MESKAKKYKRVLEGIVVSDKMDKTIVVKASRNTRFMVKLLVKIKDIKLMMKKMNVMKVI